MWEWNWEWGRWRRSASRTSMIDRRLIIRPERLEAVQAALNERDVYLMTVSDFCFFQAEDGIRDLYVTGVQTCALPISSMPPCSTFFATASSSSGVRGCRAPVSLWMKNRSEERRVGKECRSRWAADQ